MRDLRRLITIPRLALVAAFIVICLALIFAQTRPPASPQQQRSRRVTTANPKTITVRAGGNLQSAINAAIPGDTIMVEAGARFVGPFTLPDKGASNNWITIRTSAADSALPAEGERITPAHSSLLPKLLSSRGSAALQTALGAHHYRLVGLEFRAPENSPVVNDLVMLGDGSSAQDRLEKAAHHLVVDRCLVVASERQSMKRGIALNSAETTIKGSHIAGMKLEGQDSQAVGGWNGPGPFHIINNYLEAAGENLLFGGAPPSIPGLVPSDIEIKRNYLFKPLSWRQGEPSYAGTRWSVKNLFELKSARRVVFEGNILENCWGDVFAGYGSISLTVRGDSGSQATIEDVVIRHNVMRHTPNGINILGKDTYDPSGQGRNLRIENNLFVDIDGGRWNGDGEFLKISQMPDVAIDHNTVMQTGNIISAYGEVSTGFVFTNNILKHNNYGIIGVGKAPGSGTLKAYFPGALFRRNLIVGADFSVYPADNFYPTRLAKVGLVDPERDDYRIKPDSTYKGKATDSKDIGCDLEALKAATDGVAAR